MPIAPSLSVLEEVLEADHEETTTRRDDSLLEELPMDDYNNNNEPDMSSERTSLTTTNDNNVEEMTRVLIDNDNEKVGEDDDDDDNDDDVVFHDTQYVNPAGANPSIRSSFTSSASNGSSCDGNGSNHSTSIDGSSHANSNSSNNNNDILRSSSMTSSGGYLPSSTFLEPLVEDEYDGEASMEFHMPYEQRHHHSNDDGEEKDAVEDDSKNAVEDKEYEAMYGSGSRDLPDHHHYNNDNNTSTTRRVSTETNDTNQSAPPILMHSDSAITDWMGGTTNGTNTPPPPPPQRRRVTIQSDHINNHGNVNLGNSTGSILDSSTSQFGNASTSSLASRSSRYRISSRYGSSSSNSSTNNPPSNDRTTKSSFYGSILNRRRSTRSNPNANNGNGGIGTSSMYHHNSFGDSNSNASSAMVDAVERLNKYQSSDFEYVSAAAAVVSATASGKRNYVQQFGQGDHVLVILAILGLADAFGNKEIYTIDPVNKLGFPRNHGKTETQNQGPFLYVLCIVKQVHFDEDERYYTVLRCDTNTEQRADPGYMEPIRDGEIIEIAYQASQRSRMSMANQHVPITTNIGFCEQLLKSLIQFGINMKQRWIPTFVRTRDGTKELVQRLLHGEPGCALHFRFSGINFLVCCSLFFLFHDIFTLGYLPASADYVMDTIGM
jgi:hypothetical protein